MSKYLCKKCRTWQAHFWGDLNEEDYANIVSHYKHCAGKRIDPERADDFFQVAEEFVVIKK